MVRQLYQTTFCKCLNPNFRINLNYFILFYFILPITSKYGIFFFGFFRNEVLHGGELLKIRGLCRNKQTHSSSSLSETNSLHYGLNETGCEKTIYDQHTDRDRDRERDRDRDRDRVGSSAIIKESPVIVTSPQHMGNASTTTTHKPSSSSLSSSSATSGSGLCVTDSDIPKRVKTNSTTKFPQPVKHTIFSR